MVDTSNDSSTVDVSRREVLALAAGAATYAVPQTPPVRSAALDSSLRGSCCLRTLSTVSATGKDRVTRLHLRSLVSRADQRRWTFVFFFEYNSVARSLHSSVLSLNSRPT